MSGGAYPQQVEPGTATPNLNVTEGGVADIASLPLHIRGAGVAAALVTGLEALPTVTWPSTPNLLTPDGSRPTRIAELWRFLFTVAAAVFVIVTLLLVIALLLEGLATFILPLHAQGVGCARTSVW